MVGLIIISSSFYISFFILYESLVKFYTYKKLFLVIIIKPKYILLII